MAISTVWDLQPQARPAPVSDNPAITMTPAQTQARVAEMQREVLNQASPVGRMTEEARLAGQITSEQANALREGAQGYTNTPSQQRAGFSPELISTSGVARQDLQNIRNTIDQLSRGMSQQAELARLRDSRRAALQEQPAVTPPPSASDVSQSLLDRYGAAEQPVVGGLAQEREAARGADPTIDALTRVTTEGLETQKLAYDEWKSSIERLQSGLIPLNPEQQSQVNAIQASAQRAAAQMEKANRNRQGILDAQNARLGRTMSDPEQASAIMTQEIERGVGRIQDIEQKAVEAVATLKEGFRKENYELINDQYEKLTSLLDKRQSTITDLLKTINQSEKEARNFNLEIERFEETQRMNQWGQSQDTFRNMMESDKFTWQQKQDDFRNMMDSDKFTYEQKQDNFRNALDSEKFTYQQKQDVIKNALESDKMGWDQKMDMLNYGLNSDKFTYQQRKDLEDRKIELEKLALTDNAMIREEWLAAGQPGTSYSQFLKERKADLKPPTVDESKNAGFALRMRESNQTINSLESKYQQMPLLGQYYNEYAPNALKGSDMQRLEQSQRDFVNAILRRESGAAISDSEFESARKQYFPEPGDSKEKVAQKRRSRELALEGVIMSSGTALSPEWKESALSGRKTYTNMKELLSDLPDKETEIENALKNGAGVNEILKFYSEPATPSRFNQPLSMGEKGSTDVSKIKDFTRVETSMGTGVATGIRGGSPLWKYGLDLVVDGGKGAPVKTPFGGTVVFASNDGGFGKSVKIKMDNGEVIRLSHLDAMKVRNGQRVPAGTVIGTQGNTGKTLGKTGIHVDVTMYKPNGKPYSSQEVASFLNTRSLKA